MEYIRLGKTGLKVSRLDAPALPRGGDRRHPLEPARRGFLAGNRRRGDEGETVRAKTDNFAQHLYYQSEDFDVAERLAALAERRGVKPAQLALAWILHQPGVTAPIIGVSKMEHLEDAVAALEIPLSAEERKELEEPYRPHRVLGHE